MTSQNRHATRLEVLVSAKHVTSPDILPNKQEMMRHFVAFALLLFVLEISVEACGQSALFRPCALNKDNGCRARCLKQLNCQNAHCEKVKGKLFSWRCVCGDCPGGQQKKEMPPLPPPIREIPVKVLKQS
ncbi:unnamed protein product [Cylicocyclus nassatus]|uniref:Uncharacterized protein n=1 Tax=Cylicocyclus nassatus TaxID=53992 RepID=A0AA36MD04_CYLNA|nr:unnamed protein product [Cylicocyclus nassatus]